MPTSTSSGFRRAMMNVLLLGACVSAGVWVYHGSAEDPTAAAKLSLPNQPPLAAKGDKAAEPACDLFGDPLPAGAIARLGTVRLRHGNYLNSIWFAPDGKTLISTGRDGVRIWDAATGKLVRHFGASERLFSSDLSSDGRRVALSRLTGAGVSVEVWDVATGKLIHKLIQKGLRLYFRVHFSHDGSQLLAMTKELNRSEGSLHWRIDLWDAEAGREIRTLTHLNEHIGDMEFSADGKTLLLADFSREISIRSTADGKEVCRLRNLPAKVGSLVVSPRGDRIAFIEGLEIKRPMVSSLGSGAQMFLLDSRTGAELRRWSVKPESDSDGIMQNGWRSVAFSPDGRRLAACQKDRPIRIWDTATGEERRLLPNDQKHFSGLRFSLDGKTLAVCECGRSIRLIDAETGADRLSVPGHRGSVTGLAVSQDGGTIFTTAEERAIYRWDARSGRDLGRLIKHKGDVDGLALAADSRTLYSAGRDGTLRLWDLKTGKDRRLFDKGSFDGTHLTLSPDGKTLAVPVDAKELRLLNAATGECLHRLATKTRIIDFAFTADGSIVKALTGDCTVWRWELPSGRRLPDEAMPPDREQTPIRNPDIRYYGECIVLSLDGRLAAHGMSNRFLRIVELSTQRQVWRSAKLPGKLSTIAFAPDGRTLAWAEHSGVVHWLELATWSERQTLSGHTGAVNQIAFTADGKRLISGSGDTTALVWDLIGQGLASLTAKERDACWADLAEKDAAKAYRAVCRLIAAPADALALLHPRLKPDESVDEKRIDQLIADLDADAFVRREKATEELHKLGELAEPACHKALAAQPTLETRRRLKCLLDDITQHQWHLTPESLRQVRAIEVLERIGTPEARALLETLARGAPGARLTREVRAAVQRLR
jgi:WD40 repeat protein